VETTRNCSNEVPACVQGVNQDSGALAESNFLRGFLNGRLQGPLESRDSLAQTLLEIQLAAHGGRSDSSNFPCNILGNLLCKQINSFVLSQSRINIQHNQKLMGRHRGLLR
jgi:hypothetical protein